MFLLFLVILCFDNKNTSYLKICLFLTNLQLFWGENGWGGTFWGNAPMPSVAPPLIDTKTKMAELDHLEIPKSTLLQILISKFQWATPFEIHTPPVKDFGKVYLIGSVNFQIHLLYEWFLDRVISEGVNILFRSAKWAYLLGILTPPVQDVSWIFHRGVWNSKHNIFSLLGGYFKA